MYFKKKWKLNPSIMKTAHTLNHESKRKIYIYLFGLAIPLMFLAKQLTQQRNENGYQFLFFFLSIIPTIVLFDIIMLNAIKEDAKNPLNPFYLMKYVVYIFILLISSGPFLFLWGMWEVILNLKW